MGTVIFGRPDLWWWAVGGVFAVIISLSWAVIAGRLWILKKGGRARLMSQGSRIPHVMRDAIWIFWYAAGVLGLAAAVLQPIGKGFSSVPIYDSAVVIVALDVSRSCLAEDVVNEQGMHISRCEFEKLILRGLAPHLKDDQIGVLIFAQSAIALEAMLLSGEEQIWLYDSLRFIDEFFIEYVMPQGSNIPAAVMKAIELSEKTAKKKIFLFLSDGENTEDPEETKQSFAEAKKSLDKFRAQGHTVAFIIGGIGNSEGAGAPMPRRGADGKIIGCYEDNEKKGPDGSSPCKLTRPDSRFMSGMAQLLGGTYIHIRDREDVVKDLVPLLASVHEVIGWKRQETVSDYSFWLVLAAFAIFLGSPLLRVP